MKYDILIPTHFFYFSFILSSPMRLHLLCVLISILISASIAINENEKMAGDQLAKKIIDIVKAGSGYGYVFDSHSYHVLYGGKKQKVSPNRKVLRDRRKVSRQPPSRGKSSHHKDNTNIASDQIS
jgi:hypothetical protein